MSGIITRKLPRLTLETPRLPTSTSAHELALHLRAQALRKSKILWELDLTMSRRCSELASSIETLAFRLAMAERNGAGPAVRLNLAAQFLRLKEEADRMLPTRTAP